MTDHNSPMELPSIRCRKCQNLIDITSQDEVLDTFGSFSRLRCTATECGHIDWYKGISITATASKPEDVPQEEGEVWIHDVILVLSFRAEAGMDRNVR